jgi:hypothetical protein
LLGYDNTPNTPYEFNHITSQDLKLGVRFNLNALEGVPRYERRQVYAPAPVYTQPPVYAQPPVYSQPQVYTQPPVYVRAPVVNSRG